MIQPGRGNEGRIGRFEVYEVEVPVVPGSSSLIERSWPLVVIDDGSGVAAALVEELRSAGYRATEIRCSAWDELLDLSDLPDLPAETRGLIFPGRLCQPLDASDAVKVNRVAFFWAKRLIAILGDQTGAFFTLQETGGDFGLRGSAGTRGWTGGLAGLAKTAAQEWPHVAVKAIDVETGTLSPKELAGRLADEIVSGGAEVEVGLRADGRRTTLTTAKVELKKSVAPVMRRIVRDSVIVVSGGARGVTATTLVALAADAQPRFALLGRTPLAEEPAWAAGVTTEDSLKAALAVKARTLGETIKPREMQQQVQAIVNAREVRATIAALEQAGSAASYFAVDIADSSSVWTTLDAIRQTWGPIDGIVHGAGVLADKHIAEKTPAQFDHVFSVKVDGLRNLLEATANDPLRMICLFSSVAARVGNGGQADYAMANEVLNKVAAVEAARRGAACVVKSLNWGPWAGGMVNPALKTHFENMGVPLIPLDEGARRFVEELQYGPLDRIEVVLGGDPAKGLGASRAR